MSNHIVGLLLRDSALLPPRPTISMFHILQNPPVRFYSLCQMSALVFSFSFNTSRQVITCAKFQMGGKTREWMWYKHFPRLSALLHNCLMKVPSTTDHIAVISFLSFSKSEHEQSAVPTSALDADRH